MKHCFYFSRCTERSGVINQVIRGNKDNNIWMLCSAILEQFWIGHLSLRSVTEEKTRHPLINGLVFATSLFLVLVMTPPREDL